jgi:hypothetical protein
VGCVNRAIFSRAPATSQGDSLTFLPSLLIQAGSSSLTMQVLQHHWGACKSVRQGGTYILACRSSQTSVLDRLPFVLSMIALRGYSYSCCASTRIPRIYSLKSESYERQIPHSQPNPCVSTIMQKHPGRRQWIYSLFYSLPLD